MSEYQLKSPCKNCPFRSDQTAIRFACRERAEEIEESAYRNGFPCHLSARLIEPDDGPGEYHFGDGTQHCAGALIMFLKGGYNGNVPFEQLDEDEQERITAKLDFNAPVWGGPDAFLESYDA